MTNYRRQRDSLEDDTDDDYHHRGDDIQTLACWEKVAYHRITHFAVLLVLCAGVGIGLPVLWNHLWRPDNRIVIESDLRYDCYPLRPNKTITEKDCPRDSCLWDELAEESEIPCYYTMEEDISSNYQLTRINNSHQAQEDKQAGVFPRYAVEAMSTNAWGDVDASLRLLRRPSILSKSYTENVNVTVEDELSVSVQHLSPKHIRVLIKPADEPDDLWTRHLNLNLSRSASNASESLGVVSIQGVNNRKIFQLKVSRKGSSGAFFNMGEHSPFIFARGWREITTSLVNDLVYGLGQTNFENFKHNFSLPQRWFLYNQHPAAIDENTTNLFGSHPFYLEVESTKTGAAHGVLLLNTFPIEVSTNARPSLTMRPLGGHLDFHFFLGPSAAEVVAQLQDFVQRPAMPPYWALGFHLCSRQCYVPNQPEMLRAFRSAGIPVESDCGSSAKLSNGQFRDFRSNLKKEKAKWLPFDWPQQFKSKSSTPSTWDKLSLVDQDRSESYVGRLSKCLLNEQQEKDWTLATRYHEVYHPDLFNSEAQTEYGSMLSLPEGNSYILDHNTPTDDWNDPRRVLTEGSRPNAPQPPIACRAMSDRMPWDWRLFGELNLYTACLNSAFSGAKQFENDTLAPFLALHNLYGYKHAEAVANGTGGKDPRSLLMSLSTFIGSGQFGGHLGTTLPAGWSQLRSTVKQTLDMSIFGIPLVGFPVGGYQKLDESADDELIQRWYQLATVQPFMMVHVQDDYTDPINLKAIKGTIQGAVKNRYRLMPYMYTLFYRAHTQGELVSRPVFFEFPVDVETYAIKWQYMLGPALLVTPVLQSESDSVRAYFPAGRWYDIFSGQLTSKKEGGYIDDLSAVDQLNIHLRGGHVVPMHLEPNNTVEAMRRTQPYRVIIALNEKNEASGDFYIDDGEATLEHRREHVWLRFKVEHTNITIDKLDEGTFCDIHSATWPPAGSAQHHVSAKAGAQVSTQLAQLTVFGVIDRPHADHITLHKLTADGRKGEQLASPNMTFVYNYGVLNIEANVDFCDAAGYFFSWSYTIW